MARRRTVHSRPAARSASRGAGAGAHERVASEIRKARRAAGLTQRELAARLKKSPSWVTAMENGHRSLYLQDLPRIAEALGMDVLELLSRARRGVR